MRLDGRTSSDRMAGEMEGLHFFAVIQSLTLSQSAVEATWKVYLCPQSHLNQDADGCVIFLAARAAVVDWRSVVSDSSPSVEGGVSNSNQVTRQFLWATDNWTLLLSFFQLLRPF